MTAVSPPAPDPNPGIVKRKPVMLAAVLPAVLSAVATVLGILDVDPEIIAAVSAAAGAVVVIVNKWAASRVYSAPTVAAIVARTKDDASLPLEPESPEMLAALAGSALDPVTLAALAAPTPQTSKVTTAAVWSERLKAWTTVYLHVEENHDEGTFVLTDSFYAGLPVAKFVPGESATHTPIGPDEQSRLGLRPIVAPPNVDGN